MVALINFEIAKKTKISHTAEIGGLYIKPSHRNLGIAQKLIKFVEDFAKQKTFYKYISDVIMATKLPLIYMKNWVIKSLPPPNNTKIGDQYFDDAIMLKILETQ